MTDLNELAPQADLMAEEQSRFAAVREAVGGFAGRIASGLKNGLEALQDAVPLKYKMLGGAAVASFALGVNAEAASPADQACINAILARPTIEYAKMVNPGKPKQSTLFKADYPSIADVCTDGTTRKDQYQFRIKRAGRFVNISQFRLGGALTRAGVGTIETGVRPSPHDSRDLYNPRTDGPAELEFRNEAIAPDGDVLGSKTYIVVVEKGAH